MEEVGVRELKAKLSEVLRAVQRGDSVRVTSRGRVVADIVPPRPLTADERIAELVAAGRISPATRPRSSGAPPPLVPAPDEQLPSELIIGERDSYYGT